MELTKSSNWHYPYYTSDSDGKNLPAMWENQLRFLGQEDPLEKEMPIPSNILAWRVPWTEKPGGLHNSWDRKESDMTE